MVVKIGARKSDLARLQAYGVGQALKEKYPDIEVKFHFVTSQGDRDQQTPLWASESKGLFTQDLVKLLVDGEVDALVHSWKDLPVEDREETKLVATLPRADVRDLLLVPRSAFEKVKSSGQLSVLSSSPRRVYNLTQALPDLLPCEIKKVEFRDVRGNVPTRISKLMAGEADGLVLAKAALDRLLSAQESEFADMQKELREALDKCLWMVLPLTLNPTAAAQGALAVEALRSNVELVNKFQQINSSVDFEDVQVEREILKSYGGGCHQKIGVNILTRHYGKLKFLRGETDQGEILNAFERIDHRVKWPAPESAQDLWPQAMSEVNIFERQPIDISAQQLAHYDALYLARFEACPKGLSPRTNHHIWCSGLRTWQKLAQKGFWVNGCSEGLGDLETPEIDTLAGQKLAWAKLSHDRAPEVGGMKRIATYKLVPGKEPADLGQKQYFFWPSGTVFDEAIKRFPEIKKAFHACGPGLTADCLRKSFGSDKDFDIFLSHQDWLAALGVSRED